MFSADERVYPYFVCWDKKPNPLKDVARHAARFDDYDEAKDFFDIKCKNLPDEYIWMGVIGCSAGEHGAVEDYFYLDWSKNVTTAATPIKGLGVKHDDWKPFTNPPAAIRFTPQVALSKV
ncbi:hypothetical protein [Asticcacaulis sp. EMRT-3]|uniref:hypothetical protein n=1 Tax=Asticcacaulis sp. EMRT-3 TaxID=3040349 RepID=UPI0024AFC25F|nr:hypothetical protein [Asticcacaulis sp. EMRT-3]MDI7775560.1 hypothetical protein [Asticcacaulis sp. EMRT-3]